MKNARLLVLALIVAGCSSATHTDLSPGPTVRHLPNLTAPSVSGALAVLGTLPVKGRAAMTGYSRDEFGPSWTDDNDDVGGHNGCDTRNDILRRDLNDVTLK